MKHKYKILISKLTDDQSISRVNEHRGRLIITFNSNSDLILLIVSETGNNLVIDYTKNPDSSDKEVKRWQFPIGSDQDKIFKKIVPYISIDKDSVYEPKNNICPFIGKLYYSDYSYMVDINTNEPTSHSSAKRLYEPRENQIIIKHVDELSQFSEDIHLKWHFLRKQDNEYIFKDELDNVWALSKEKFTKTIDGKNKIGVIEVDEV